MYVDITEISMPDRSRELLAFLTFSTEFNLFDAVRDAVQEYCKKEKISCEGMDPIEWLKTVKAVPDELCAKHGFQLFKGYHYRFIRVQK